MKRRSLLLAAAPVIFMPRVMASTHSLELQRWLKATRYVDTQHPQIVATVRRLVGSSSDPRERAVKLHDFVRDEIKFGFSSRFYDQPASQVLSEGLGFCNTKSTLLIALLRAAEIPARQHFVDINSSILQPLISPGTQFVDHSYTEVFLAGQWIAVDSYIVDQKLFAAAKSKLAQEDKKLGYGIHGAGRVDWDGRTPAFSQFLNDGSVAQLSSQDHGVYDDVGAFYEANKGVNRLNPLLRLGFGFLARPANNRIEALR